MTNYEEIAEERAFPEDALSKIGKDVLKYSPSKIIGTIINLLLVPIYTNLLSPDEYGLYNLAIGALSFLCIIFSDWVGVAGLRFFKEHHMAHNIKSYFSTLLFLLVSNLIIMYSVGFFTFKAISDFFKVPSYLLYIVFLLIIPVAIRALLFQVLRAQIKPLTYTISVIVNQATTALFAIYFIKYWHLGPMAIMMGMAFSIVVIDLIMLYLSNMLKSLEFEGIKFNILNNYYSYGVPLALSSLGLWIISQSNKFVLQHYKGSYYNGLCGVGFNLTFSIVLPLFAIITLAAIPRIFNKYEAGDDVNPIITKLTGYYFVIFSPVILILCLFSREMVYLFSNKDYTDSYVLIPFLALSIFFFGLTEYTTIQYHLAKKTYIDTIARLIPGFISLGLSVLLIPKYGILGVGISTLTSYGLYLLLSLFIRIKGLHWRPPYREIFRSLWAILVCIIVFSGLKNFFHDFGAVSFATQAIIILATYLLVLQPKMLSKNANK